MYLIRRAKTEDVPTLLKLAKMVHFINLPADRDIIAEKISRSRASFLKAAELEGGIRTGVAGGAAANGDNGTVTGHGAGSGGGEAGGGGQDASGLAAVTKRSDLFMFVLEEVESPGALGTSQIISRMGGPGRPNLSFQLSRREFFSTTLKQGGTHVVAKLVLDESGPTEIGGLILQPSLRGHPKRLGRLLSLVRFHVMGLYRPLFADRVLAEMMAPITPDGRNTLWEYLGRRFINLTYEEADRFCQHSKEFMLSLLPREEIYLTLLPPEARSVVGQVGPETVPARQMLEKLGFEYREKVDPFDGGPNLEAATDAISLVQRTRRAVVGEAVSAAQSGAGDPGIVSVLDSDGEFRAVEVGVAGDRGGKVRMTRAAMKVLGVEPGSTVGVTLLRSGKARNGGSRAGKSGKKKTAGGRGSSRGTGAGEGGEE